MKNKGQALVEFIIVLPILLLILTTIIDFSNIMYNKYSMENSIETITELYKKNKTDELNSFAIKEKVTFTSNKDDKLITLTITRDISIITPGLQLILKNPYPVKVKRVIYDEK